MAGKLELRSVTARQRVLAESRVTTGPGVRIVLRADRVRLSADGEDVAIVSASLVDAEGRIVPIANDEIEFRINGLGRRAARNVTAGRHELECAPNRRVFNALSMAIAQAAMGPRTVHVEASCGQLASAAIDIVCQPAKMSTP
jgi:beta-galactosidase